MTTCWDAYIFPFKFPYGGVGVGSVHRSAVAVSIRKSKYWTCSQTYSIARGGMHKVDLGSGLQEVAGYTETDYLCKTIWTLRKFPYTLGNFLYIHIVCLGSGAEWVCCHLNFKRERSLRVRLGTPPLELQIKVL